MLPPAICRPIACRLKVHLRSNMVANMSLGLLSDREALALKVLIREMGSEALIKAIIELCHDEANLYEALQASIRQIEKEKSEAQV